MSSSRDARAARRAQRSQQQNADAVVIQAQSPLPRGPVRRQRDSRPCGVTDPVTAVPDISAVADEHVDDDHLCPICQLLLHEPVRTTCNHTLCRFCMATWASVSLAAPMVVVDVDEIPIAFDPVSELEARCPMCRTLTSARPDHALAEELKARYPETWAERNADGSGNGTSEETQGIQTLTVYIGNRHKAVPPPTDQPRENQHEWSFFVKPSRNDIIEEVHIHLHPSFDNSHIIRQRPPYQVEAQGWGVFTITASVILKAGYSWVSDDAQNTPDGAPKGMLPLEWTLTFDAFGGKGAMGRCRLKVKNDRLWDTADNEGAKDRRELRRMVSQYERDGRWEP